MNACVHVVGVYIMRGQWFHQIALIGVMALSLFLPVSITLY
jgi:hypothetical protein